MMSAVSLSTLLAALCFTSFHIPIRILTTGKAPRLIGISYHVLLLPAIAALPAPEWAKAAGFAWMLLDIMINGAVFVGLQSEIGDALRQGVHVISAVWVITAGWTNGGYLAITGTLLGIMFLTRFFLTGYQVPTRKWLLNLNAALNVLWMVTIAIYLWHSSR